MGTPDHIPGPRLRAAVLAIAKQRDWEVEALPRWPILERQTKARIEAHTHDLAALAGAFGYRDADALADACRAVPDAFAALDYYPTLAERGPVAAAELAEAESMGGWEPRS